MYLCLLHVWLTLQNDIDAVSQSAAMLHGVTLVRNKDIRKLYV